MPDVKRVVQVAVNIKINRQNPKLCGGGCLFCNYAVGSSSSTRACTIRELEDKAPILLRWDDKEDSPLRCRFCLEKTGHFMLAKRTK